MSNDFRSMRSGLCQNSNAALVWTMMVHVTKTPRGPLGRGSSRPPLACPAQRNRTLTYKEHALGMKFSSLAGPLDLGRTRVGFMVPSWSHTSCASATLHDRGEGNKTSMLSI